MLVAVIMAGGAGTRFWPLSTEEKPKQFLRLFGERTLLQMSYDRVAGLVPPERVLVLTAERFLPLVQEQLPQVPQENVIGEPLRRDTAAAVALAAAICRYRFGNATMAVFTADHIIQPVDAFQKTVTSAAQGAEAAPESLYTFGVQPSYPATGYGYLQLGEQLLEDQGHKHFRLRQFREKPDQETARQYLSTGQFLWNSGMFVWTTDAIWGEFQKQLSGHLALLEPVAAADGTPDWQARLATAFEKLPRVSVDFGIMEKARDVRCISAGFDWSDVGGWLALKQYLDQDAAGNWHQGALTAQQAGGNIAFCDDPQEMVALVGVEGLVVVRAGNRTLVASQEKAEAIKKLVAELDPQLR